MIDIDIKFLRSAGLTDTQILDLIEAQRTAWREQKRNQRANVQRRPRTSKDNTHLHKEEPSLPSTDVANATSVSGRAKRKPTTSIPDPWPWPIRTQDAELFADFRRHALEKDRRTVRWDMAWERWQTSQFNRKPNGAHGNGSGRARQLPEGNVSVADIHKIADEYRRREAEQRGADLFRSPDDAGSHRRSG